jgi:hypothetical protein
MRTIMRRRGGALRPVVVLGFLAGSALAAAPGPAALAAPLPGAPYCQTPGLVVWLDTNGNGAAGSFYYNLEFTNLSGHKCSLEGYPYVYAINLAGGNIANPASFNNVHAPAPVLLLNGGSAKAVLRVVDTGAFPVASCHPVTAAGLKVYPPNQTRSKNVPFPFSACSHPGQTSLSVEAVQKA